MQTRRVLDESEAAKTEIAVERSELLSGRNAGRKAHGNRIARQK